MSDPDVLCIDHIDGGGTKHKEAENIVSIWKWLLDQGYPAGFQLLCANCNLKKELVRTGCTMEQMLKMRDGNPHDLEKLI